MKRLTFVTLISVITVLSSCTPLKTHIYKSPSSKYHFEVVQILDFRKLKGQWVPYDSTTVIPDMLYEKLLTSNKFIVVERISKEESEGKYDEKTLLVKGTVTGYNRGCKFCEWLFFGINDKGKSSISVWVEFVDKSTGKVIADMSIEGRAEDPGYGKSRYTRVVDAIYDAIDNITQ